MKTTVLTIAGSDSGGGAGIQADLKTFEAHGLFGASALTAITCQDTRHVHAIEPVGADTVACQVRAVIDDMNPAAVKTGMLYSAEIVKRIVSIWESLDRNVPLVCDPVMVSTGSDPLSTADLIGSLPLLFSQAALITPNIPEAEALLSYRIDSRSKMRSAVDELYGLAGAPVLLKGGHALFNDGLSIDIFYDCKNLEELSSPLLPGTFHGTGCTFSAAVAARLALGENPLSAVVLAKEYVTGAIRSAFRTGGGSLCLNHGWRSEIASER